MFQTLFVLHGLQQAPVELLGLSRAQTQGPQAVELRVGLRLRGVDAQPLERLVAQPPGAEGAFGGGRATKGGA